MLESLSSCEGKLILQHTQFGAPIFPQLGNESHMGVMARLTNLWLYSVYCIGLKFDNALFWEKKALTFWFVSFLGCLVIFLAGVTPILADLNDSRRLLMVLWKISCTSSSFWLMVKSLRLYLWRCCGEKRQHASVWN